MSLLSIEGIRLSFVSIEFTLVALVFFPLYWGMRSSRRLQMFFLMLSGYAFYATWSWDVVKMLLVFGFCVWVLGMWVNSAADDRTPRVRIAVGIVAVVHAANIWLAAVESFNIIIAIGLILIAAAI